MQETCKISAVGVSLAPNVIRGPLNFDRPNAQEGSQGQLVKPPLFVRAAGSGAEDADPSHCLQTKSCRARENGPLHA